jgi:hypothetical protein
MSLASTCLRERGNLAYDGNRFNRTAATAPLFNYLAPSESTDEKMVSQEGIAHRAELEERRPVTEAFLIESNRVKRGW